MSSMAMASRMNFGGVVGLTSTLARLYCGFKGSFPWRLDWNLTIWGAAPPMSFVFKLVSSLIRPMWSARGPDLSMSQFEFVNSYLFTCFEPWSFGAAPKRAHKFPLSKRFSNLCWVCIGLLLKLTSNVSSVQVIRLITNGVELCSISIGLVLLLVDSL